MHLKSRNKLILCIIAGLFCASILFAQTDNPTYLGVMKCKLCHKKVFATWYRNKHSKAWQSLKPEEQSNPECIECHTTGGVERQNVQCEACHGPGSGYAVPTIMHKKLTEWKTDREAQLQKALDAGLINKPDEELCTKCHNKRSPNFKEFKFKESMEKIKHWK